MIINYHRLTPEARRIIRTRMSIRAYVTYLCPDGFWRGDRCGCPDDRCRDGYHHEPDADCPCLPIVLWDIACGTYPKAVAS